LAKKQLDRPTKALKAETAALREHDRLRGMVRSCTEDEDVRERAFIVLRFLHETALQAILSPKVKPWVPLVRETEGPTGRGVMLRWSWDEDIGLPGFEAFSEHPNRLDISLTIEPNMPDRVLLQGRISQPLDVTQLESLFVGTTPAENVAGVSAASSASRQLFNRFKRSCRSFGRKV
jgi:hypothetical protein